jgi:hypothetical protein
MVALRWSSIFIKEIGARLPSRQGAMFTYPFLLLAMRASESGL